MLPSIRSVHGLIEFDGLTDLLELRLLIREKRGPGWN